MARTSMTDAEGGHDPRSQVIEPGNRSRDAGQDRPHDAHDPPGMHIEHRCLQEEGVAGAIVAAGDHHGRAGAARQRDGIDRGAGGGAALHEHRTRIDEIDEVHAQDSLRDPVLGHPPQRLQRGVAGPVVEHRDEHSLPPGDRARPLARPVSRAAAMAIAMIATSPPPQIAMRRRYLGRTAEGAGRLRDHAARRAVRVAQHRLLPTRRQARWQPSAARRAGSESASCCRRAPVSRAPASRHSASR